MPSLVQSLPRLSHFSLSSPSPSPVIRGSQYPYATNLLPSILRRDWNDPIFALYKSAFPPHTLTSQSALIAHVNALVAADVKDPALKKLQGYLWRIGYSNGDLSTPLFGDVVPVLRRWVKKQGLRVVVFSSGSVEAQRMFFSRVRVPSRLSESSSKSKSEPRQEGSRNGAASAGTDTQAETGDAKGADADAERTNMDKHEDKDHAGDTKMSTEDPTDPSNAPNPEPEPASTTNGHAATANNKPPTSHHGSQQATTKQDDHYEDLNPLFLAHYDTQNAGPKNQSSSYVRIAVELKVDADCILFLSDSVAEVRAARDAGMRSLIVERDGNAEVAREDRERFGVIGSLSDVEIVPTSMASGNVESGSKGQVPKPEEESRLDVNVNAEGPEKPVKGVKADAKPKGKGKGSKKRPAGDDGAEGREVRRSKRLNRG